MLVNAVRFIKGYVSFEAHGKFPERFINLTARYGVNIWDAHPSKYGLSASMGISDYRKIRKIAKKSKIKTKIIQKHGLPFFAHKYKTRFGLLAGAAVGIVLLIVLSNFIWCVNITGTKQISPTYLEHILAENGVSVGAYKNNLDVESIERTTTLKIDDIGWMSINITGNIANVEIKEKYKKPEILDVQNSCNIKAAEDGVITKIKAYKGKTMVLRGSGVVKGDVLVSGIMDTKLNTIEYVHANAEVYADVISKREITLPLKYNYYSLTEKRNSRSRLSFLWLDFPCSLSFKTFGEYVPTVKSESLYCNNVVLPLKITTQTDHQLIKNSVNTNIQTVKKSALNDSMLYEVFKKPNAALKSRKISYKKGTQGFVCTFSYVFNENIAKSVDFKVTQ